MVLSERHLGGAGSSVRHRSIEAGGAERRPYASGWRRCLQSRSAVRELMQPERQPGFMY